MHTSVRIIPYRLVDIHNPPRPFRSNRAMPFHANTPNEHTAESTTTASATPPPSRSRTSRRINTRPKKINVKIGKTPALMLARSGSVHLPVANGPPRFHPPSDAAAPSGRLFGFGSSEPVGFWAGVVMWWIWMDAACGSCRFVGVIVADARRPAFA